MRGTIQILTAVVILLASGSASYAASDSVKCDSVKTLAAAKLFKGILACNHKGYAGPSCQETLNAANTIFDGI